MSLGYLWLDCGLAGVGGGWLVGEATVALVYCLVFLPRIGDRSRRERAEVAAAAG